MDIQNKYRIGYALSGGGARGVAHLGVLKALEEMGIMPEVISGTSAGAIIGAFYAQGYGIEEIMDFIGRIKFFSLPQLLWRKSGFFDMRSFEQLYTELIPHHSFEGLKMPVHIATTDIVRGEVVYFNSGNLIKPLLATSCIPLIYQPIEYQDKMLVDGGVLNNFPIEPLIGQCDYIVGVHVNSLSKKVEQLHFKDMLDRSFHFALSNAVYSKSGKCDLFIDPPDMSRYGMFDLKKSKSIYAAAYHHTHEMEKQIMDFRKIALGY